MAGGVYRFFRLKCAGWKPAPQAMLNRVGRIGLVCLLVLVAVLVLLRILDSHSEALQVDYALVHYQHGRSLRKAGQTKAALREFRKAIRLKWNWPVPLNGAAWILATDPNPEIRRPQEALALAQRAAEVTGNKSGGILDTLAAAHAALGQYDQAVATARAALSAHSNSNHTEDGKIDEVRARLRLYRQSKPYLEPAP